MAQLPSQKQEVIYWYDEQGRICANLYAKALCIHNGGQPICWKYIALGKDAIRPDGVHHAELLRDTRLEVTGQHSAVECLTPNTTYNVFFDVEMLPNMCGFDGPVTFDFTDQNGKRTQTRRKLTQGCNEVLVGKFTSGPGWRPNVEAKMHDYSQEENRGLLVRRMRIMPIV